MQKTSFIRVFVLAVFVLGPFISWAQSNEKLSASPFVLGEALTFTSDVLGEDRTLNIYLPPSYEKAQDQNYPVIYLLDGSRDEDFIHIAGLVQFGSFSWIKMIPESIVVGIANVDRKRDFTYPTRRDDDRKAFPTYGHSEDFMNFLEKEVQPLIRNRYRCTKEATLIGQSLGGLLATQVLLSRTDLFDNYVIVSPSLWWDDQSLLEQVDAVSLEDKTVFVAVGKEGDIMERDAMNLFVHLKHKQKSSTKLYFKYLENQDHGDALHLAVYEAFEKIFVLEKTEKE